MHCTRLAALTAVFAIATFVFPSALPKTEGVRDPQKRRTVNN
jgi:hypothetical protein